ncbi:hypothetical protein BDB00DRAFT_831456 [Zychaea mexicana]|uniref:uncharacterized protein n=1 Tax=Zychaea mexicana TaxID=64656 RepID=UPI0022FE87F1|nr:uncharacterized protein BDB00DRAFT_831456 [Zychaea mexicana]KAI9491793.1 hypothetical protein BDB00DRAFT_831456 [Zychaea mexicana]
MSNLIAFIFPSGAHALMLLAFAALLFFAVPTDIITTTTAPDDLYQIASLLQRRDYAVAMVKKYIAEAGQITSQVLLPLALHWFEHVRVSSHSLGHLFRCLCGY